MLEDLDDSLQSGEAVSRCLRFLEGESVSGAIQLLLNSLFVWSRTCDQSLADSIDDLRPFAIPSVIHREARQMVYDGLKEVRYTYPAERRPYVKPRPPSADRSYLIIHRISHYAASLPPEQAAAFFVALISQWILTCSAESILQDARGSGESTDQLATDQELVNTLRDWLGICITDYESLDAAYR